MSSRKVALANKRRGRAFQAKLAELARGVNIGTLGGEDVSHVEFSYEAKTVNINSKKWNGKPWMGERFLTKEVDQGYARNRFGVVEVASFSFTNLILVRWYWWSKMVGEKDFMIDHPYMSREYFRQATRMRMVNSFIGNTFMNQAEKNCPDGKLPVVVVHTTGRRHEQDIAMTRDVYWESLLSKLLDKTI